MTFKSFFSKVGAGFKKAGQWIGKQAQTAWKDVKSVATTIGKTVIGTVNKVVDAGVGVVKAGTGAINNIILIIGLAVGGVLLFSIMNPGKAENIAITGLKKIPSAL